MLATTAQHAVRALLYMAQHRGGPPIPARRIADATGIPHTFLPKLLLRLVQQDIVTSTRGRGGGFALAVPPDQLTIARIVALFDDPLATSKCLLGDHPCILGRPCAAHAAWVAATAEALAPLERLRLADLLGTPPRS